jgi:hypothetical protein
MTSQPGRSRKKAAPPTARANRAAGTERRAQQSPAKQPAADPPSPARSRPALGGVTITPGIVLLGIGAFLILLAFSVLDWFRDGPGFFAGAGDNSTFGDLHNLIALRKQQAAASALERHVSFGVSEHYFGWLGWLLFLAAVGLGAVAVSRFGARHWYVRWLASVVAVAGGATSLFALNLITFEGNAQNNADAPTFSEYFAHSGLGVWAAMLGFVLIAIAVFLPRRDT